MKILPENPEYADMRHGDVILIVQGRHGSTCSQCAADVRLFISFYISHRLVRVHGNPDLVCKKGPYQHGSYWDAYLKLIN